MEVPLRAFPLLAFCALLACDGGDSDDTGSDTSDTSDTGSDTSDTGSDTSDTGADTAIPDPGPDFVANGPGSGTHFAVTDPVISPNDCGVGSQNSLTFIGDTVVIQSVSTTLMEFALSLQAANVPGSNVCAWTDDGLFTCDEAVDSLNLNYLQEPYALDAIVVSTLDAEGLFRERVHGDPAHTFSARWAADIDFTYTRTCTGTECSQAAAGSGATGFPCTSEFRFETVNYSDPTLPDPR